MAFLELFKEHFKNTRGNLTSRTGKLNNENMINTNLEQMFQLVIDEANKNGSNEYSAIMKSLKDEKIFRRNKADIHSTIMELHNENQNLKKKDRAITRAHWGEIFRAFLLRIFTTIGVASILLLTSYIALELKIPLPLRMGFTP